MGLLKKVLAFLSGGGVAAAIQVLISFTLHNFLFLSYYLAHIFGLILAITYNFFHQNKLTFDTRPTVNRYKSFIYYNMFNASCQFGIVFLLTQWLGLDFYLYYMIFTIGFLSVISFLVYNFLIFKK